MPRIRPAKMHELNRTIEREFGRYASTRVRTLVADTVLAQMLPPCAIKGGSALKMRLGDAATRFTRDVDVARPGEIEHFVDELSESLERGWEGFSGRLIPLDAAQIETIPEAYIMQPFEVSLWYANRPWTTIALEIGHDEIGDTDEVDFGISPDIIDLFERLGLPEPGPVPLLSVHHQVAQKLHALSTTGSNRAHDLIDLQLLDASCKIDLAKTRDVCVRLFAFRCRQAWPPIIEAGPNWDSLYLEQKGNASVLETVDEAVTWANDFVARIDGAGDDSQQNAR